MTANKQTAEALEATVHALIGQRVTGNVYYDLPGSSDADAITTYTRPGDTVLDPMCGIGTSLVEAVHLDRNAVGVELEPTWPPIARGNLQLAYAQGAPGVATVHRHLLIRRNRTTGELAYYRYYSPEPVPLTALVRVAGSRWRVVNPGHARPRLPGRRPR
jgi:hypothetical protein